MEEEALPEAVVEKVHYMTGELARADKELKGARYDKAVHVLGGIDTDCDLCQEEIDIAIDQVRASKKTCKTSGKKQCERVVTAASNHIHLFIEELEEIVSPK